MARRYREEHGRMHWPSHDTAEIVIPTGRSGFCCIVPCALMVALEATGLAAGLLLARRLIRRARRRGGRGDRRGRHAAIVALAVRDDGTKRD